MIRLSDNEEQQAQRIACTHLVMGCEGAVSQLLRAIADRDEQSPTMTRAGDILADTPSSWRETLGILTTEEEMMQ